MEIAFLPNWILTRLSRNESVQWNLNVLFSCLLLISVVSLTSAVDITKTFPHVCIVQYLFRIPCPGCGITRSLIALSRLDMGAAWRSNPVGPFLGGFLLFQLPARTLAVYSAPLGRTFNRFSAVASRLLVISLVVVWLCKIL
jgi:hypothetical protein